MKSKIYESDVVSAFDSCGEYFEFRHHHGVLQSRRVQLFTHGPTKRDGWQAADGSEPTRGLPAALRAEIESLQVRR